MDSFDTKIRIHFRSLGCPKNQLDSEIMLGQLGLHGFLIVEELAEADVVIINTCSFIQSAREESIQAILEVADLRENGSLRALIVAGCLPQRYGEELARELPEVDAFVGTGYLMQIQEIVDRALSGQGRGIYVEAGRSHLYDETEPRMLIGAPHSVYVKLAEGCNRVCAFCAIPKIRGKFQSRSFDSVIQEVRQLATLGVQEVNLVAQDSNYWGQELPGESRELADLLHALDQIEEIPWIRLLYNYPTTMSDALIEILGSGKRILPYVDVPLQHASTSILKAMKRGTTREKQTELILKLRERIPNLVLRSTFIVGFPGETEEDFETLCQWLREMEFDRVGCFRYSDEEGTAAWELEPKIPRSVARERLRRIMTLQQEIMQKKLAALVGTRESVLVDQGGPNARGRIWSQAPEIDGVVFLNQSAEAGSLVPVTITGVQDLDLRAEILEPSPVES